MAFPFHHRKLLNQTIYDSPPYGDCDPFCFDVYISPSPPPPPPSTAYYAANRLKKHVGLSLFLTIAISVLATVFFLLTFYTIYKLCSTCRQRRRRSSLTEQNQPPSSDEFVDEDHGPEIDHPIWYIRTVGLQPSVVSAITVVRFKKGDGLVDGTDCSVCLSEFRDDEMLRLLPKCNHAFHVPCIDTWLRSHTNCPMCRAGIVSSSAVSLPVQEVAVVAEENRVGGGSERREEVGRELGREDSVLRIEIGVEEDGVDDDSRDESKIETMRRSVSVDFLSVPATYHRGESNSVSNNPLNEVRESSVSISGRLMRLVGSSSTARPESTGPSNVKRSLSCSAKV